MQQTILLFILTLFVCSPSLAQDIGHPGASDGGEYLVTKSECVHSQQRREITERLQANTDYLEREGILTKPGAGTERVITLFNWPLQQASGFNFNSYYGISNYIDQNLSFPNQLLDYNCGTRTYDLASGYNHRGTDIFLWPLAWQMVNNNQVEVIAAAAGTIIGKDDGNPHNNCDFSNPNWNAVYVQHADGSVAWYGHMKNGSLTTKTVGQSVTQGEYLGIVASSGSSTGPHLHFEIWTDNTYTTLVDPWAGACNSMTASTWWNSQKPYREPTVNHVIIGTAPIVTNACPTPDVTNEAAAFLPGSTIYFTSFFHDQLAGQVTNRRLLRPNGTLWGSWADHTSPSTYTASYWWHSWTFPGTEPLGTWTFEITHNGVVLTYPFEILSVLPVELITFTGKEKSEIVTLEWTTASEVNNDYFEIEHSADGRSFSALGRVAGKGNSIYYNIYTFDHMEPLKAVNYYRLKQVDLDGKYDYSNIISIYIKTAHENKLIAYPNPAIEGYVYLSSGSDLELNELTVYDQLGRVVLQNIALTEKTQEVDVRALANGFYIFVVSTDSGMLYERVFIE